MSIDVWTLRCIDVLIVDSLDVRKYIARRLDVRIFEWTERRTDGWMNGSMNGWIDAWMDG